MSSRNLLEPWFSSAAVRRAVASFSTSEHVIETAIAVQQIPAPTFAENQRGAWVRQRMQQIGLADVSVDPIGNVYGRVPGHKPGRSLLIAAHLDTVFAAHTDLAVRREGRRIYGPGLGDNSLGVAGLLHLGHALREHQIVPAHDIWLVANVCEEGLGDLRGMRAALQHLRDRIQTVIALEGTGHDRIVHEAVGVRRYKITAAAPGGHSWQNFGAPSAIHTLVRLAERLTHLEMPQPRSSFNIGVIEGGTSVNAIAESAALLLDLRSVDPHGLESLVQQTEAFIAAARAADTRITITAAIVGDRPAGRISRDHVLVRTAAAAYHAAGATVAYGVGSTDANVAISMGIPAICVGIADGANAHRLDEYVEIDRIGPGMCALLWLALAASS
ncbi:MAG: M20/M25/M40 family metallo-hydrolase [Roseiflexaceae bacterium]|nr:M20/M25/M40 family metallo-hydrolase [Roseiflexaceae bacterium]